MTDPIDLTLSSDEESPPDDPPQPQPQPQPQRRGRRRGDQPQPDLGMIVPVNVDEREQEVNLPTPTLTNNDTDEGLKPSTTSGTGLWDLWTRNFKSPLFALLDLIDNSVDAALLQKGCKSDIPGRVQIYRDVYKHGRHSYTTGLCIRNNSMNKITSLDLALNHLFSSDKVTPNTIGENGVGMKQAAASLSDMTFVLVKNGSNEELELGIIAKVLQNEVGCFLPCFKFNDLKNLSKKMTEMFKQSQYASVAKCVAEYGKVTTDGVPSLDKGIERLCKHYEDICKKFHDNPYVFEVILDKVHDRNSKQASRAKDKQATVAEIMKTLQNDIPMRYLHIDDTFKFSVGKKELTFRYWQERLVEFTQIVVPVRSKTPWHEDFATDMPDQYDLRIFLGFDRFRIAESDVEPETGIKKANKQCSLYIYSRMSGRMILREKDCRVRLRLNAGGTDFCQALTVIIDDVDGHLPVNPTKQDVVFSNQSQGGDTHEENLYTMVRTVVAFYYTHHKKKYGGKKNILTSKISQFVDRELPDGMKSCANCKLTTYEAFWNQTNTNMIRVDHSKVVEEPGVDTVFRLLEDKTLKSPGRTARKRKPPPTKTNSNPEAEEELEATDKKRSKKDTKRHSPTAMRSTPRRAAGRPKKYGDDFNDNGKSDSEDTSSEERGDNVKKSKSVGKSCLDLCLSSDDESESRYGKKSRNPKIISPGPKGKESNEALENRIDELEIENSILKAKTETLQEELKAAKRNIRMLEREIQRAEE